ncbi:MAG: hypothetical protein ACXU86_00500 [Archangium sp.]
MLAVVLALLAVIPCEPGETSTVCYCKAGMLSACETLRLYDPRKTAEILAQLERAAAQAKVVEEVREKAAELEAEASSEASEPPSARARNTTSSPGASPKS